MENPIKLDVGQTWFNADEQRKIIGIKGLAVGFLRPSGWSTTHHLFEFVRWIKETGAKLKDHIGVPQ